MKLFIILCIQFLAVNIAYAGNKLNGNLNNNNANAELNVGYVSDTTVNSNTRLPVGSAYLPTVINSNGCARTIQIGGNGVHGSGVISIPIESKFCQGQLLSAKFPRYSPMWWAIECQGDIMRKADKIIEGGNCPTKKKKKKNWIVHEYPDSSGRN